MTFRSPTVSLLIFTSACGVATAATSNNPQQLQDVDVIILGGGMAGLAAAEGLARANITNFKVVEARKYLGGRVHALPFGDASVHRGMIEVGANWIHGASPLNPLWRLAVRAELRTTLVPGSSANVSGYKLFTTGGGKVMDAAARSQRMQRGVDCINATAQRSSKDQSLAAALSACGWHGTDRIDTSTEWEVTSANYILAPKELSLNWIFPDGTYSWLGSDDQFVHDQRPPGYAAVTLEVLRDAGLRPTKDPRVLLSLEAAKVDSTKCDAVRVRTVDGQEFRSRYVISTLPLGVMQERASSMFVPPLPAAQAAGIAAFTMGNFTKIFAQFPERFWASRGVQWLAAADGWDSLFEFHDLGNLVPGFNTLFTYAVGRASEIWEAMTDEEAASALVDRLRRQFPGRAVGRPSAFYMTRHGSDPLMRGAYSTQRLGVVKEQFEDMVAPVASCGSPRVFFAGEHTCLAYTGYLHGAYLSGLDAASDVLGAMGREGTRNPDGTCRHVGGGRAGMKPPHNADATHVVLT